MTQSQQEVVALYCPRCGGLMHRAAGSSLYWHANNNHPRCNITNIVAATLETQAGKDDDSSPRPQKEEHKKDK